MNKETQTSLVSIRTDHIQDNHSSRYQMMKDYLVSF